MRVRESCLPVPLVSFSALLFDVDLMTPAEVCTQPRPIGGPSLALIIAVCMKEVVVASNATRYKGMKDCLALQLKIFEIKWALDFYVLYYMYVRIMNLASFKLYDPVTSRRRNSTWIPKLIPLQCSNKALVTSNRRSSCEDKGSSNQPMKNCQKQ